MVQAKKTFHCYKELWTNNSLQENDWNTKNVDDNIAIMKRLCVCVCVKERERERERERESTLVIPIY